MSKVKTKAPPPVSKAVTHTIRKAQLPPEVSIPPSTQQYRNGEVDISRAGLVLVPPQLNVAPAPVVGWTTKEWTLDTQYTERGAPVTLSALCTAPVAIVHAA